MAHPAYLRDKARALRAAERLTIDELAERLALSRSTIYYWVRDMPIPGSGSGGGWPASAHRAAARSNRRRAKLLRDAAYREGVASFDRLVEEPTFRDFVTLYIAEGYKRSRNTATICNSDPAVMTLAVRWLRRLTDRPLRCSIQYHADQDEAELRSFWAHTLRIDEEGIRLYPKSNSGQLHRRVWRCRYGVVAVAVYDTLFRARLQAWIDCLQAEWLDSVDGGA